ncbi:hypothetical protein [Nocardia sp. IFM 10818]
MPFGGESASGDLDALDRVLASAHAVGVRELGGDSTPLLEERDPVAVRALREALRIADLPGFICLCWGDVALDFYDAAGTRLATVTLHHGYSLRWNGWAQDAVLADGVRSLEWLAVRGVTGPLAEYRAAERRREQSEQQARLWAAQIPPVLIDFRHDFLTISASGRLPDEATMTAVRRRLLAAYPDPVDRLTVLLAWFASGSGKYSGYPAHEDVPAVLADGEDEADFVRAAEQAHGRAAAGAARYLRRWDTRNRVDRLLSALSPATRRKIVEHAHDDEDRRWLAHRIARLK